MAFRAVMVRDTLFPSGCSTQRAERLIILLVIKTATCSGSPKSENTIALCRISTSRINLWHLSIILTDNLHVFS